ncbi:MAG TPA: transposase [Flavobacterium sp.]|nr:transposase [Flavobacterium sp.]
MNQYNPNKHHRRSIRLQGYDYSQAGLYFITICCEDRICRFGHVENGTMILNKYGQIAYNEWMKTPEIRPNVKLHEFVVMPNHIHGIMQLLDIGRGELHSPDDDKLHLPDDSRGVCKTPLRGPSQTIGAIVRGYKSSVTKQINLLRAFDTPIKLWQRNYHDHIIRNEQSYQRISEYIKNNPVKWNDDKFYKK